jgi:hypothetical protein
MQLPASAKGQAQMYLRENPWNPRRKSTKQEHEQAALRQGQIAVNSILRDWIKGQVTAVESGILSFEAVFLPYMLTADGRPLSRTDRRDRTVAEARRTQGGESASASVSRTQGRTDGGPLTWQKPALYRSWRCDEGNWIRAWKPDGEYSRRSEPLSSKTRPSCSVLNS